MVNEIDIILSEKHLDERIKPFIKLFFLGRSNLQELNIEQLKTQIDILCSRITNVEFSSSDKIIAAYERKANILTVNKNMILDGKSDEVILPLFMKFEEVLNLSNRRNYANHIEDFINAGRLAKSISIPMSDKLHKLYESAEYCYGDIESKVSELINDSAWEAICSKYNNSLNEMIITGIDNQEAILEGARLFHYEIFTSELLNNPDFEGPYKTEEYQKKASTILSCINIIEPKIQTQFKNMEKENLTKNIKLFTGYTEDIINEKTSEKYVGDSRISTIIESALKKEPQKITEDFIVDKLQKIIDRKPEWDRRVTYLIIPFFIRSQQIYNWNMDELQERINQLDLKIDKIIFEDLQNIVTMGSTAGDTIKLNSRVFLGKNRKYIISNRKNDLS